LIEDIAPYAYPPSARNTVRLGRAVTAQDFDVAAPVGTTAVDANVIGVIENQAPTRALVRRLPCRNGLVEIDVGNDVCHVAVVERHRATGAVANGFVSGFGYGPGCAVASSVAHDSHHIIAVGTSKADMARAVNRLGEVGGGIVVFRDGRELALVELPIAGLMSDQRAEIVAARASRMIAAMEQCGCRLNNAYMQHSLLALVVIPELRISDIGLVDVRRFEPLPLLAT
jgi:adenine deaminase